MALYINTNVASLEAQVSLSSTQQALDLNLERLSSGLRINEAADDSAGLGISESLRAEIAGLQQASRNGNDGVALAQVADGAMNEQSSILTRLRALAVESANSALASTERGYINTEAVQLTSELDRIASVTSFEGVAMLSTGSGSVSMQVGAYGTTNDTIALTFSKTDSTSLGVQYGVGLAVDLSTATAAQSSIANIDSGIDNLSSARAEVGAGQNRLGSALDNLSSITVNLQAADARIRSVDVAAETAAMTENQVLLQSGVAVLAQANQLPSLVLQLLK